MLKKIRSDMKLSYHRDKFEYLPEKQLPVMVMGIKADFFDTDGFCDFHFNFKNKKIWKPIVHQTAGIACHHHYLIGQVIKPKTPDIEKNMKILSDNWLDSNVGSFGVTMNNLQRYNNELYKLFDVDCNKSYGDFEEGIAPIDIEYLDTMTKNKFPKKLNDLLEFDSTLGRILGSYNRWGLWILMENCD